MPPRRRNAKNRSIRLTDSELELLRLGAQADGERSWTDWARRRLIPLARRAAREAGLLATKSDDSTDLLFR